MTEKKKREVVAEYRLKYRAQRIAVRSIFESRDAAIGGAQFAFERADAIRRQAEAQARQVEAEAQALVTGTNEELRSRLAECLGIEAKELPDAATTSLHFSPRRAGAKPRRVWFEKVPSIRGCVDCQEQRDADLVWHEVEPGKFVCAPCHEKREARAQAEADRADGKLPEGVVPEIAEKIEAMRVLEGAGKNGDAK